MIGGMSQDSLMKLRDWKLKLGKTMCGWVKEVRRDGGGSSLIWGGVGGLREKECFSWFDFFFRLQTRAKSRAIEGRLSQERYKVDRVRHIDP
jgi:hypothetical protein